MRGMVVLVVVMGIAIVAGTATLAVLLIRRAGSPAPVVALAAPVVAADEPEGSRIAGIAAVGDRLAVWLTGGGADRVLFLDPRNGAVAGRFSLGR